MKDSYQELIEILFRCRHVLVTTHVSPDGDALGSCAAAVLALRQRNIEGEVLLLSHLPRKYAFIFKDTGIVHHEVEKGWEGFAFDKYDALLVVDTGTWSQLPGLESRIKDWNKPILIVDHHLTQEAWGDVRVVDTKAAAAAEVMADVLQRAGVRIDHAIAEALYLGLTSDTGWFQFSNTRPVTLRLAASLMEQGVDTDRMYQALYQNERVERVRLLTRALDSLEVLAEGRLAVMRLRKKDFQETGAGMADTENLINVPLQIATVQVAILITEPLDAGPVKMSLRSKGQVDVAGFAQGFGGGGHARAAGLKVAGKFEEVGERVVEAMVKELGR